MLGHGQPVASDGGALGAPSRKSIIVGRASPGPVAQSQSVPSEFVARLPSVFTRSTVHRPCIGGSVDVDLPGVHRSPDDIAMIVGDDPVPPHAPVEGYVDVLVRHYGYPGNGRRPLPISTPLFNKFVGVVFAGGLSDVEGLLRLRDLRVGRPAVANRLQVCDVARCGGKTYIRNLEGRRINTFCSSLRLSDAHQVGKQYHAPGCMSSPPLPKRARPVYIGTRKVRWCSVGSVAFHSFACPCQFAEAKGIARTLFTNHCGWAGVFVVRGRCFSCSMFCLQGR